MSDLPVLKARTTGFIDNGDGTANYVYGLEDGSCLRIQVTISQGALHLEDLAKAVADELRKKK